jgi:hypothetical protein
MSAQRTFSSARKIMAKLYYDPYHRAIAVRRDDDDEDTAAMIEVTAEQAAAISLYGIRYASGQFAMCLKSTFPHRPRPRD